mgnify:FL=1|jgi:hypothetical protein
MVVERKISLNRYVVAGIITFLVFTLGLLLGLIMDNERVQYLDKRAEFQEIDYNSLQLQYLYLSDIQDKNSSCPVLRGALKNSIKDLSYSLELLENYQENTQINSKEYELISRRYLLDNIKYWIFSKKTKEICDEDIINILYFYSEKDCDICHNQGTILSYFKVKLQDEILIFPLNTDTNEDFIDLLQVQYNITSYPSIIVNNEKFEGIVSKEKLLKIICENSINKEKCLI